MHRTWVRVQRLSYEEVEDAAGDAPFRRDPQPIAERFRARRRGHGATSLDLPEVSVRVRGRAGDDPSAAAAREPGLVTDAMLMAGEAAARFCLDQGIPIPFATQAPPENGEEPHGSRGDVRAATLLQADPPVESSRTRMPGLGLALYTRATSPLRRYSDLLVASADPGLARPVASRLPAQGIIERERRGRYGLDRDSARRATLESALEASVFAR